MTAALPDARRLARLPAGPVAVVLAEDGALLAETLDHLAGLGFPAILLARDPALAIPDRPGLVQIDRRIATRADAAALLSALNGPLAGRWLHWCFNAEFLFYPFCGTRPVRELVAFMEEERREAVAVHVVDLYATDLAADPDGVSRDRAAFDAIGHWVSPAWKDGAVLDRTFDLHGGLAWRYEEHVPWEARRCDRPALFRAARGLAIGEDFRLSDPERNTRHGPWHRNVTAALASFRVAKALRRNPDARAAVAGFVWEGSRTFDWSEAQLRAHGFMESGQWF